MVETQGGTSREKRTVFIYIALTLSISWILEYFYVFQNKPFAFLLWKVELFPLMMIPGLLALSFLLIVPGYRVRDIGFHLGGWDNLLIGIAYPLLFVGAVAGLGMLLGLAFYAPQNPSTISFLATNLLNIPLVILFALPSHLGEELGWRGFLLKKTLAFGKIRAATISSGVWALFHIVVALRPSEGTIGWLWNFAFILNVFAAGFVFAWLYIRSGSVWPVFLMHSLWNFINPLVLGNVYRNHGGPIFKADVHIVNGEGVLGCCISLVIAGIIIWSWLHQRVSNVVPNAETTHRASS